MNNENITYILSTIVLALGLPLIALMLYDIILIYIFDGETEIFGMTLSLVTVEPIAECK